METSPETNEVTCWIASEVGKARYLKLLAHLNLISVVLRNFPCIVEIPQSLEFIPSVYSSASTDSSVAPSHCAAPLRRTRARKTPSV